VLALFRMPSRAYRHNAGWMLGRTFLSFTHVGRRSGNAYQTTAMVLRDDRSTRECVICAAGGGDTDWVRDLSAAPSQLVEIGRESFVPTHRFLTDAEAFVVALGFRAAHPHRLRLISRILGWGDLRDDTVVREFVRTHPFVAFRPR
jgi:deazaflavin-dependent oxidoreductase (nitroreductase family)